MRDDPRILDRVKGVSWEPLRSVIEQLHTTLLNVDPGVAAELTTIYAKYKYSDAALSPVFAVMWLRNSKQVEVGLAMPDDSVPSEMARAISGIRYPPLNAFLKIKPGDVMPANFSEWVRVAFEHRRNK